MNIEVMRMLARQWFDRGTHHTRTESECAIYVCAAENATHTAFESMGKTSIATFQAHKVYDELSKLFDELLGLNDEDEGTCFIGDEQY